MLLNFKNICNLKLCRGVMDESGEQFVAYFLPTDDTMVKRAEDMLKERDYDDDGEYEYKMFRSVGNILRYTRHCL